MKLLIVKQICWLHFQSFHWEVQEVIWWKVKLHHSKKANQTQRSHQQISQPVQRQLWSPWRSCQNGIARIPLFTSLNLHQLTRNPRPGLPSLTLVPRPKAEFIRAGQVKSERGQSHKELHLFRLLRHSHLHPVYMRALIELKLRTCGKNRSGSKYLVTSSDAFIASRPGTAESSKLQPLSWCRGYVYRRKRETGWQRSAQSLWIEATLATLATQKRLVSSWIRHQNLQTNHIFFWKGRLEGFMKSCC